MSALGQSSGLTWQCGTGCDLCENALYYQGFYRPFDYVAAYVPQWNIENNSATVTTGSVLCGICGNEVFTAEERNLLLDILAEYTDGDDNAEVKELFVKIAQYC